MNRNKREFKINYGGQEIILETGRMAKQADGSVLISSEGTQVLVTVCSSKDAKDGQDFFPLTVDYTEKFYAAGKFLGGFLKRESRPSVQETLNARLIDRPLRPLFPEGYLCDTTVQATVLSYSEKADPEILAGLGASAALTISDIPFNGPIGTCKVGRVDGEFILNPSIEDWERSDMEIGVAANKEAILMVEGEAKEVPENEILDALIFAHKHIISFCYMVDDMRKNVGKEKREFIPVKPNEVLMEKVTAKFKNFARACLEISPKLERQKAVRELEERVAKELEENPKEYALEEDSEFTKQAVNVVDKLLYNMMRSDILDFEKRIGGRRLNEVRAIDTEVDVLKVPHGSSLFTRGETQVLATVTIGGSSGEQMVDRITGLTYDKFYLHYNFPPFSVAEARPSRAPGRREQGHGNLAFRALKEVMPASDEFSYTTRVVCEVLESNGSSSMASVCSGSMALMDAGVPLSSPVAGIAMGLVTDGERYKVLSDILGDEDHLGDMDFKVAGTEKGVTAIQMDIKIIGISNEIISRSLAQANEGRMHILGIMNNTIKEARKELKDGVPKIVKVKIDKDKIGALIGPGGKNIKALQENYQVNIECEEDGTVKVIGTDKQVLEDCKNLISLQIEGPAVGSDYDAEVVTIKEYGAFVDIVQGVSGLVHISELTDSRVKDVNEYVSEGDKIKVRVVDIDKMGRIKLSAKAVKPLDKKEKK